MEGSTGTAVNDDQGQHHSVSDDSVDLGDTVHGESLDVAEFFTVCPKIINLYPKNCMSLLDSVKLIYSTFKPGLYDQFLGRVAGVESSQRL